MEMHTEVDFFSRISENLVYIWKNFNKNQVQVCLQFVAWQVDANISHCVNDGFA